MWLVDLTWILGGCISHHRIVDIHGSVLRINKIIVETKNLVSINIMEVNGKTPYTQVPLTLARNLLFNGNQEYSMHCFPHLQFGLQTALITPFLVNSNSSVWGNILFRSETNEKFLSVVCIFFIGSHRLFLIQIKESGATLLFLLNH